MVLSNKKENIIEQGIKRMNNSTIVICSIVRDCGSQLKRNIPKIEKLRANFSDSSVIIVENDSIDNTKDVLTDWKSTYRDIHIIGEDTNQITIPLKLSDGVNPFYSIQRIEKMSKFRNMYLDYIEKLNKHFDYLMVIDLDINYFDLDGIKNSFGQGQKWDAITSNGTKFLYKKLKKVFHDSYALLEIGEKLPQTETIIEEKRKRWSFLKSGFPMIPVASGFNGLAIYKCSSVKGCKYFPIQNNDPRVQVLCEHVSLHQQMIERGHNKIYINPSQITIYRENIVSEIKKIFK